MSKRPRTCTHARTHAHTTEQEGEGLGLETVTELISILPWVLT